MVANTEAKIWERVVDPSWEQLDPRAAEALLRLRFTKFDLDRMNVLAELAREGGLSADEQLEIDSYERIGNMLAILQSRARLATKASKITRHDGRTATQRRSPRSRLLRVLPRSVNYASATTSD